MPFGGAVEYFPIHAFFWIEDEGAVSGFEGAEGELVAAGCGFAAAGRADDGEVDGVAQVDTAWLVGVGCA